MATNIFMSLFLESSLLLFLFVSQCSSFSISGLTPEADVEAKATAIQYWNLKVPYNKPLPSILLSKLQIATCANLPVAYAMTRATDNAARFGYSDLRAADDATRLGYSDRRAAGKAARLSYSDHHAANDADHHATDNAAKLGYSDRHATDDAAWLGYSDRHAADNVARLGYSDRRVADNTARLGYSDQHVADDTARRIGYSDRRVADETTRLGYSDHRAADNAARLGYSDRRVAEKAAKLVYSDSRAADNAARLGYSDSRVVEKATKLGYSDHHATDDTAKLGYSDCRATNDVARLGYSNRRAAYNAAMLGYSDHRVVDNTARLGYSDRRVADKAAKLGHSEHRADDYTARLGYSDHHAADNAARLGYSDRRAADDTTRLGYSDRRVADKAARLGYSDSRLPQDDDHKKPMSYASAIQIGQPQSTVTHGVVHNAAVGYDANHPIECAMTRAMKNAAMLGFSNRRLLQLLVLNDDDHDKKPASSTIQMVTHAEDQQNEPQVLDRLRPLFFREHDLKEGSVTHFSDFNAMAPPLLPFLPRSVARKFPFSTTTLKEIFRLSEDSEMRKDVERTVSECHHVPAPGETRRCVVTVEDMINYVISAIGTNNIDASNTVNSNGFGRDVSIGKIKMVNDPTADKMMRIVTCHQVKFPFLLHHCHSLRLNRVYEVQLLDVETQKEINRAMATCHLDTSDWICHWLAPFDIIWTATGN